MSISNNKEKRLTLKGHLIELRQRLIRSIIVVAITTGISFIFAVERILDFFQSRAPEGTTFIVIETQERVSLFMQVGLYAGLVLALPFLTYQIVMFIRPALTPNEKKYLYTLLPGVVLFFFAGAVFTYYIFLPPALEFLIEFPLVDAESMIRLGPYISMISKLLFIMGLVFELPIVIYFFTRIGILSPKGLSKYRKFAYVGAFIISAIVTPTIDPINQTVVAVPIMILYEIGVLLARVAYRQRTTGIESQI